MRSMLALFVIALVPIFPSRAESAGCDGPSPGLMSEGDVIAGLADSLRAEPERYRVELGDGTAFFLEDAVVSEEKDIYEEIESRPELEAVLAELAEPSEFAGKAKGKRTKVRKKGRRYTNRGILSPAGRWPVKGGGCATLTGSASFYGGGERLKSHTASGRRFQAGAMAAAHRTLPLGARVSITNTRNGRTVASVVINDRGPAIETGREIDVTKGVAQRLGFVKSGHTRVSIRVCRGR